MPRLTALLGAVLIAVAISACELFEFPPSNESPGVTPAAPQVTLPAAASPKPPGSMPSPSIEIPPPI